MNMDLLVGIVLCVVGFAGSGILIVRDIRQQRRDRLDYQ